MASKSNLSQADVAVAARTLVTAGFSITNSHRLLGHIEIECERSDIFGRQVRYLIALCEGDSPPASDVQNIRRTAGQSARTLVVVCMVDGADWISWKEFLYSLGGAVPTWRALGSDYEKMLLKSATNTLPRGQKGEAWQVFEDAVADGFEFVFGNRVNRLGGKSRGKRVSDMVTQSPDNRVLVLDAKAARKDFKVTWAALRPLVEYTKAQITRQRGHFEVSGAILVARRFEQATTRLEQLAGDFVADVRAPLTFLTAEELAFLVCELGKESTLRSSINWSKIFCRGGLVTRKQVTTELAAARRETYSRHRPHGR